jgi:GNAT superfamily N-acetyltransferase
MPERPHLTTHRFTEADLAAFADFTCAYDGGGDDAWRIDLDGHPRENALSDAQDRIGVTWPFYDDPGVGVGYAVLSADGVTNKASYRAPVLELRVGAHIPALLIGRFAVRQGYQGTGVGPVMMDWIKDTARNLPIGCKILLLQVQPANTIAVSFYEKQGFLVIPPAAKDKDVTMYYDLCGAPEALFEEEEHPAT